MLKKIAAVVLLAPAVCLSAACIVGAPDDSFGAAVEPAKPDKPGQGNMTAMPPGPCATACMRIAAGACGNWDDECADVYPDDENVTCAGKRVTCDAAREAARGEAAGVMYCYRVCEHLR